MVRTRNFADLRGQRGMPVPLQMAAMYGLAGSDSGRCCRAVPVRKRAKKGASFSTTSRRIPVFVDVTSPGLQEAIVGAPDKPRR